MSQKWLPPPPSCVTSCINVPLHVVHCCLFYYFLQFPVKEQFGTQNNLLLQIECTFEFLFNAALTTSNDHQCADKIASWFRNWNMWDFLQTSNDCHCIDIWMYGFWWKISFYSCNNNFTEYFSALDGLGNFFSMCSGYPNAGLVRYSDDGNLSISQMVHYSDAIWKTDWYYHLNIGHLVCYSDADKFYRVGCPLLSSPLYKWFCYLYVRYSDPHSNRELIWR